MIHTESYPYLLFSSIFSKASALFSRRAKQSLFCLVIVTTGKMAQNGSILLKRTTFLSIHNLTSVFFKIKKTVRGCLSLHDMEASKISLQSKLCS